MGKIKSNRASPSQLPRTPAGRRAVFVPRRSARAGDDPFVEGPDERASLSMRVLHVFEFFRETGRATRSIEVSRALQLPSSSVDRMLKVLVRQGYLQFDFVSRLYSPSYRMVIAASDLASAFHGGIALGHIMEELHRETGDTVTLCVQNDCWIQSVAAIPGSHYDPAVHGEGMRSPILGSAPGNALMAQKTDREISDAAQRARDHGYLELDARGFGNLMEFINRARLDGYAAWKGFSFPGAVAIAVAVKHSPDKAPVAVSLIVKNSPRDEAYERELGLLIRKVARKHLR
ncbi:MAG TPA: helix-turn-helix domain-containing protein [Burkholderiales bacterium]|nr:helix-turn-helix domain-containing protein [Burkholderiales bacterium]